jgi:hypothetical protein
MLYINSILLLFTSIALANDFIELETKQSIDNLRYVSTNGKVTYYQSRSGTLSFSTNYKNTKLIEQPKKTQYNVVVSDTKKRVLIEVDTSYHSHLSLNKLKEIYVSIYGSKTVKKIARGISTKLHLDDSIMSYYLPRAKKIELYDLDTDSKRSIKVFNKISPYYRPTVEMLTNNEAIYNDINEKSEVAILNYSFVSKKHKTLFKSKIKNVNLNFCLAKNKIVVLETSQDAANQQTNIYEIDTINNEDYKKSTLIYSSTLNDVGNITCKKNEIFFIKSLDYNKKLNAYTTDIAKINLTSKVLKRYETKLNPTQLIKMDELILTTKSGKYYLVEGNNTKLTNDGIGKGAL